MLAMSEQPVKRKRGRPPKHTKAPDAFPTLTLQFETPDGASPAELNSNMMVKMGEPDAFTPLMKVLPTVRRKRRKSSLASVSTDASPSKDVLTPVSALLYTTQGLAVSVRTLDNMHMLTRETPSRTAYGPTPLGAGFELRPPRRELDFEFGPAFSPRELAFPVEGQSQHLQPGPPAESTKSRPEVRGVDPGRGPDPGLLAAQRDLVDLSLAALSETENGDNGDLEIEPRGNGRALTAPETAAGNTAARDGREGREGSDVREGRQGRGFEPRPFVDDNLFSLRLVVDDAGRAMLSQKDDTSDDDKHIVPQTPKHRVEPSLRFEPDPAHNLTPLFNAMMYTVMSLDSPRREPLPPDLSSSHDAVAQHFSRANAAPHTIDTHELIRAPASPDEGDARAALKKVFYKD